MVESNFEESVLRPLKGTTNKENDKDESLLTFMALDAQNVSKGVYEICSKVFPCGMETIKAKESLRKYDHKSDFYGFLDSFVH